MERLQSSLLSGLKSKRSSVLTLEAFLENPFHYLWTNSWCCKAREKKRKHSLKYRKIGVLFKLQKGLNACERFLLGTGEVVPRDLDHGGLSRVGSPAAESPSVLRSAATARRECVSDAGHGLPSWALEGASASASASASALVAFRSRRSRPASRSTSWSSSPSTFGRERYKEKEKGKSFKSPFLDLD